MRRSHLFLVFAIGSSLLAGCAAHSGGAMMNSGDAMMAPARTAQTSIGPVLADDKGMTLYTFAKDAPGKSNCNGKCAANWPPLMASADAKADGGWSVIKRDDGSAQWAYKGKPLYGWVKDKKPGDTTGDGFHGAWHAARP